MNLLGSIRKWLFGDRRASFHSFFHFANNIISATPCSPVKYAPIPKAVWASPVTADEIEATSPDTSSITMETMETVHFA